MEGDGRTARPRDFPSLESYRVSRRVFKKLIDTPALTKMTALLAKNKEMKIHTAAHIAARYTTGACANSIARRLVIHFKAAASEYSSLGLGHRFDDERISLSRKTNIILTTILESIEEELEGNFLPLLQLDSVTFEKIFNNVKLLLSGVRVLYFAFTILRIMRPAFYRKIIFNDP